MDISIDSWGDVIIAFAAVGLLLAIGCVAGARMARRRQTRSQMKIFRSERLSLESLRRDIDEREINVVRDERDLKRRSAELDERDAAHDDVFRDHAQERAELDQREAAIAHRERMFATRKPSGSRGW